MQVATINSPLTFHSSDGFADHFVVRYAAPAQQATLNRELMRFANFDYNAGDARGRWRNH
jgi:hypothetical protein